MNYAVKLMDASGGLVGTLFADEVAMYGARADGDDVLELRGFIDQADPLAMQMVKDPASFSQQWSMTVDLDVGEFNLGVISTSFRFVEFEAKPDIPGVFRVAMFGVLKRSLKPDDAKKMHS